MTTLPCTTCGRDTTHSVELTGLASAVRPMCAPCADAALDELADLRCQFEALLAAGVSRVEANRTMISRIDGASPS